MVWDVASGMVGAVLSRTPTEDANGLTQQGAVAFVLDAKTLSLVRTPEQVSVGSLANSLMVTTAQEFIAMDLGARSPRGIQLYGFAASDKQGVRSSPSASFVAYTFKTRHSTRATSPLGIRHPRYSAIDENGAYFYKWSDDDKVYTELAHCGIVEVGDGLLIFFVGEGPSLDNYQTGLVLNAARNVGFVKVDKNISAQKVLSAGTVETGGFYNLHGQWTPQENRGIRFLTSFDSVENSTTRLKTARLSSNTIILLWEVWTRTDFKFSQLMVVDDSGAVVNGPWTSQFPVRLALQDDMHVVSGRAVAYAGAPSGKIIRYEFCAIDNCPDHPGTMVTRTRTATTTRRQAVILSGSSQKLKRFSLGSIAGLALALVLLGLASVT